MAQVGAHRQAEAVQDQRAQQLVLRAIYSQSVGVTCGCLKVADPLHEGYKIKAFFTCKGKLGLRVACATFHRAGDDSQATQATRCLEILSSEILANCAGLLCEFRALPDIWLPLPAATFPCFKDQLGFSTRGPQLPTSLATQHLQVCQFLSHGHFSSNRVPSKKKTESLFRRSSR